MESTEQEATREGSQVTGASCENTDHQRRLGDLERAVAVLNSTLGSTADGVLVVDSNGGVVALNEPFIRMWRIPPDAAARRDDRALLAAALKQLEDPAAFLSRVNELYDHPANSTDVDVLRFKDGRVIERRTRPFQIGDGPPAGRVWTFRDITEQQLLLSRAVLLSDASRLLATLDVEAALGAVVNSLVPTFAASAACETLSEDGKVRRIAQASTPSGMLPPPLDEAALRAAEVRVSELQGAWAVVVPIATRAETYGAFILVSARGEAVDAHVLALTKDLAHRSALAFENSKLYRRMERALKNREEFLSVVAHEIRGPLTTLHLAAQALQKGGIPPEQTRRVLQLVEREDRRIAGFVDDLLELGRIQNGQLTVELEDVNLGEVANDVAARLQAELERSRSSLSLSIEPGVTGRWDRARVDQVVTNLLTNAIKYGNANPIRLEVGADADAAWLQVVDRGIGVPADRLPQLFQPFERAVNSRQYGGLGLGLFIVKSIVDQLGGSVEVRSTPNEGSTFKVVLPRSRSDS